MTDAEHPPDDGATQPDGAALARGWLENSPFVGKLGIRLEEMEPDRARLAMPFSDSLPTMGEVVHGGASPDCDHMNAVHNPGCTRRGVATPGASESGRPVQS